MKKIFLPLAAVAMLLAGSVMAQKPGKSHDTAVARNLTTFNAIVKALEENYVDSIRTDEAFKEAIAAYVATVDPYTEYYDAEEVENLSTMTTGEYGGIGSYILTRDGHTFISMPYKDSPAALAGLKPGDRILAVDSQNMEGKASDVVTKVLRGVPGTIARVKVARPHVGPDSLLTIDVPRKKLQMPSVPYYGVVGGNTGYIELSSFIDKSPEEVKQALEAFKANPEVTQLILDLRGNGGGLLESAVQIVGMFVPKGTEVVRTKGKDGKEMKTYKTTHQPILPDMPLAVLIDAGSASASEITAGALQDLDRAVLIGTQSFGKGLVQNARPLPYDGLIKVTVAKYYIPSGRLIQALDYAHRNEDGSAARIPDSLTNVFRTAHGRQVRDGGGLKPDFEVSWGKYNTLLLSLAGDFHIFDFANRYAASHPSVPQPEQFVVSDSLYAQFVAGLPLDRLKYQKQTDGMIQSLRDRAELDGYLNDEVKALIDSLGEKLAHDAASDLQLPRNRQEIGDYLAEEILERYYYAPGKTRYSVLHDPGIDKALEVLSDKALYRSTLNLK